MLKQNVMNILKTYIHTYIHTHKEEKLIFFSYKRYNAIKYLNFLTALLKKCLFKNNFAPEA